MNFNEKPAVVVLTVEKYNELLQKPDVVFKQQMVLGDMAEQVSEKGKILVTGGAGYIGSHLVRQLLEHGYEVVILDNLSTGKKENIPAGASFIEGDLKDVNLLRDIFAAHRISAVVHMAASIEVEESVREPEKYFENNVGNTEKLLVAMNEAGVKKIIFSSTAAVYGEQEKMPITENSPARPNNPYGYTKLLAEKAIKYYTKYAGLKAIIFRYFNACGCDFDGSIIPTHESHLIPIVLEVAKGIRPHLQVYGGDYKTFDGTCIRDYVHVLDIAKAHVAALEKIDGMDNFNIINIGTGRGSSVKEVINAASEVLNKIIPMEIGARRAGDSVITVADNTKLKQILGYELKHSDLETIIKTSWNQISNKVSAALS